jgi:hypothetical protein
MTALAAPALILLSLAVANPSDEYEWGRNAFLRGEYSRAIGLLQPLLYPELRLGSEEEVVQTHRMLGVAYLFEKQPAEAKREFRKLLELAPDFQFDPYLDPPSVVEFFQSVVREQRDELGDIEARLKKREAELSKRSAGILERRIVRHSYGINFVPFGAGQFQNGEKKKGWVFLAAESAFALTSVTAFTVNFAIYGFRPVRPCLDPVMPQLNGDAGQCAAERIDHRGENISSTLTGLQMASGGLFFAAALWGIVDSIRHFKAEVPGGETFVPTAASGGRAAGSADAPEAPAGASPAPARDSLQPHQADHGATVFVIPVLTSTSPGAMVTFAF